MKFKWEDSAKVYERKEREREDIERIKACKEGL